MNNCYLAISGNVIKRVQKIIETPFYRAESRQTTLSGGLAVDRGDLKKRLEVTIRIMSAEELTALEEILDNITATAEFYSRNKLVTIDMIAQPITSCEEIYLYNDRNKGVYYVNVKFTLEEQ